MCISDLLMMFGANMAFHSDKFKEVIDKDPIYFFWKLPIFADPELLVEVKKYVCKRNIPDD